MHLPDTCWGEAPVGCLPCSYHDLIRQNLQVHSRDDPHNINTTSLTPLAFTVPPSLLPPDLGSSSHPYFHILLGYSFLSSPFPPHRAFSLLSSVFSMAFTGTYQVAGQGTSSRQTEENTYLEQVKNYTPLQWNLRKEHLIPILESLKRLIAGKIHSQHKVKFTPGECMCLW